MRTDLTYMVITRPDEEELAFSVNAMLDAGWSLAGGLSVSGPEHGLRLFHQAITFPSRPPLRRPNVDVAPKPKRIVQALLILTFSLTHLLTCSAQVAIPATNTLTLCQATSYSPIADTTYVTVKRAQYAVTNVWRPYQVAPGLTNWRIAETTAPAWLWTNTHVVGVRPTIYPPLPGVKK